MYPQGVGAHGHPVAWIQEECSPFFCSPQPFWIGVADFTRRHLSTSTQWPPLPQAPLASGFFLPVLLCLQSGL